MDEKQKHIRARIESVNSLPALGQQFEQGISQYKAEEQTVIRQAYLVAQEKHRGQTRDEGAPYFTHCLGTAINAMEMNAPARVVCAALLHDTLEDTDLSIETLREQFGDDVSRLVEKVSKRVNGGGKIPAEQYFAQIKEDPEACLLKGCDRLSNLYSLPQSPNPDKTRAYIEETRAHVMPLIEETHPLLAQRIQDALDYLTS